MGLNHQGKIVTDGLVLCLDAANPKSYPGSGTNWFDLSGNGYNGILTNGPTFDTNNKGSISFDGTNDKVTFNPSSINTSAGLTVEIWFKTSSGTKYQDIFDLQDSYGVWIVTNYNGSGKINTSFNTNGSGIMTADYIQNNWYQIILSGYGTSNYFHLNGIQQATNNIQVNSSINLSNARIGQVDGDRANEYLIGNVSTLKIYNRALSAAEIQQNFQALRGRYGI